MSEYNTILSNIKAAVPELSDPQNMNPSDADLLIKIASGIAPSIDNTISEMDNTETIITDIIGNQRYLKDGWYVRNALAYQEGDDLLIDPATFDNYYAVIDTTKQIVKQAAFIRTLVDNGLFELLSMKVAKIDSGTGKLTYLDSGELASFKTYFYNYTAPGLPVQIYSLPPNILNFNATVTYYSSYNLANLKIGISNQLEIFRDTFTFNGKFFINDLCTFIKNNVPGVRNIALSACTMDTVDFTAIGEIDLDAGYFDYNAGIDPNTFTYESI